MEAHCIRLAILAAAVGSLGASYRTPNFVVEAPSPEMAKQIGQAAEKYRRELATDWLGNEMPNWSRPCPITCQVGDHLGAGGATSFVFEHGEVYRWTMTIQGSLVRILDSVLPHEVTHTVFATHFRQPLPRWADEGACTTVEHASERQKQQMMLIGFLREGRGIAFNQMFTMKDYPHDVMPLYSQGYSVARYLIAQGGKRKFLDFIADGLRDENWNRAMSAHYGIHDLGALQNQWLAWVKSGSPALEGPRASAALAAADRPGPSDRSIDKPQPGRKGGSGSRRARPAPREESADGPSVYELASTSKDVLHAGSSATDEEVTSTAGKSGRETWHSPRRRATAQLASDISLAEVEKVGPVDEAEDNVRPADIHQVTRPQPFQRPRQVILEWTQPERVAGAETAASRAHAVTR